MVRAMRGKGASNKNKNSTSEAVMFLKTKEVIFCLVQKRTQNEANLERQMRVSSTKSGFLETSPKCLVRFSAKHPARARFLSALGMAARGKTQNSGNEAKKWLKTKDITFFNGANYAHFAHKLAQIVR
jgi:hypothetical protein